jgi:glycosyltransferase involved in cell wall biosynthesis
MVIVKIWDADYPWDVRVEKVCHSLQKKHRVHLVCRNTQRRRPYEEANGLFIHRLPALSAMFGRLNTLIGFPAFFNPLWVFAIWRTIRRSRADVILVRDLPLALAAVVLGRWFRIPVVLDMAENYPAMMEDVRANKGFSFVDFVIRNPSVVRAVEKLALRHVDRILVVVEESHDRLIEMGVQAQKISVVGNSPTMERFLHAIPESLPFHRTNEELVLIYLGLLEWPRGVETAILAIAEVRKKLLKVRLLILGSGRDEERFRALIKQLNLAEHIDCLGWVDYTKAMAYIAHADIGLVPHHATDSWNSTIPNKLFDYMSMGKPVIVSNAKPTQRIVQEERCGIVFQEQNSSDLARAILALADRDLRDEQGKRGREAVVRTYNWPADESRLLQAMEGTANARSFN